MVGEFGWDHTELSLDQLKTNLRAIEEDTDTAGDMFWALRGRKDGGEFMAQPGPRSAPAADGGCSVAADGGCWALYYPGRATAQNSADDMRRRIRILTAHAAAMSGAPRSPVPR